MALPAEYRHVHSSADLPDHRGRNITVDRTGCPLKAKSSVEKAQNGLQQTLKAMAPMIGPKKNPTTAPGRVTNSDDPR